MKALLLILSLMLSLFSGDKHEADAIDSTSEGTCCFVEVSSPDTKADYSLNHDLCITAAPGQTFADGGGSNSTSVRNTNTGRRTSLQTISDSRIIKGGKIIDNNRTHPFLTPGFVMLSGMNISERYLFSICRLRL